MLYVRISVSFSIHMVSIEYCMIIMVLLHSFVFGLLN